MPTAVTISFIDCAYCNWLILTAFSGFLKVGWLRCSTITSRQIRLLLKESELITVTKIVTFTPDEAGTFYKNTNRLRSTQNKTKILRLIHGDVYCGERLKNSKCRKLTQASDASRRKHLDICWQNVLTHRMFGDYWESMQMTLRLYWAPS